MIEEDGRSCWLVGASLGGNEDKTADLVAEGVWRFWPNPEKPDQYREKILKMRPGDPIGIKATYTRKYDLPFDNTGLPVSVLAIKAIGEVTENPGDGKTVHVNWHQRFEPPREWFFYTYRGSVWELGTSRWMPQALAMFAFEGAEQDLAAFRNHPYWRDRFGDGEHSDSRFAWTAFYQAFADKLRDFADRRKDLVDGLHKLHASGQVPNLGYLFQKASDGNPQFIDDICPFTFMSAFNRGATVENRRAIAAALARIIGLDRGVPEGFDGIPVVNNQRSWFFAGKADRGEDDIDRLWQVFRAAQAYADADGEESNARREGLAVWYDRVSAQMGIGWNLSMGLYWIRPWTFLPLDQHTRRYIQREFDVTLPASDKYRQLTGEDYLDLLDELQVRLEEDEVSVNTFPEVSLAALGAMDQGCTADLAGVDADDSGGSDDAVPVPYSLDTVIEEGCFFPKLQLERMLNRLAQKKNLILQGPPGTGKTWLSRKLGHALIGFHTESQVIALQFHPTLSYEDFVRGWRPSGDGRLDLVDGPFMQAISRARSNPDSRFVIVIEEINRGNPAQIFGEMLTLIEGDKRDAEHGMRLSHMHEGEHQVHVPKNLYVIGTMNVADRSLALVDLALRRRFAFFDLEPQFNEVWVRWVTQQGCLDEPRVRDVQDRMRALNEVIANDDALGSQFQVGHSYVTPRAGGPAQADARQWFIDVVDTEVRPLLQEYWFDRPERAEEQARNLLEGW